MLSIFHTNVSQEKFAEVSEVTTYNLAPVSIICTVGIRLAPSSECSFKQLWPCMALVLDTVEITYCYLKNRELVNVVLSSCPLASRLAKFTANGRRI